MTPSPVDPCGSPSPGPPVGSTPPGGPGQIRLPAADGRISLVSRVGVGRCLATLATGEPTGRVHEVTGPYALDLSEVAEIAARHWRVPIHYLDVSPADFQLELVRDQLDPWWCYAFSSMFASVRQGRWTAVTDEVQRLTRQPPRSLPDVLAADRVRGASVPLEMTTLIVDGANVVGSRPDGWWRDRPGAAARLHAQLVAADLPFDEVVLVLEGQARAGVPTGEDSGVRTVHAPADGDTTIADLAATMVTEGEQPTVVTADRALAVTVTGHGAQILRPGWLLDRLES